jgi:purine-nucleoside phosphorylase
MSGSFAEFEAVVRAAKPRAAVVLGSGLGGVTDAVRERASVAYGDIPGFVPTTVHGHRGKLVLGIWNGVPVLIAFGRLHFYEGHSWDVVTGLVRAIANLGVPRLILTNAAGGIHPTLNPGSLMAIRGHLKLYGPNAWRTWAEGNAVESPYSKRLLDHMLERERAAGWELLAGVYAALTGPTYETISEVLALKASGADAAGMSTAMEAEAAVKLGMEVAAISCITNKAAGLSDGPLDHKEVLDNAKLAVERLAGLLADLVAFE